MKINDMRLTREIFIAAFFGACGVALVFCYIFLYAPLLKKLKASSAECRSVEIEVQEARNTLEMSAVSGGRVLTAEEDPSLVLDELTDNGKSCGVKFVRLKPMDIIDAEDTHYKIMPVSMELYSTDEDIAKFLGLLDTLKKSVVKISNFDIVPDVNDRTKIITKLEIEMFFIPEKDI